MNIESHHGNALQSSDKREQQPMSHQISQKADERASDAHHLLNAINLLWDVYR